MFRLHRYPTYFHDSSDLILPKLFTVQHPQRFVLLKATTIVALLPCENFIGFEANRIENQLFICGLKNEIIVKPAIEAGLHVFVNLFGRLSNQIVEGLKILIF